MQNVQPIAIFPPMRKAPLSWKLRNMSRWHYIKSAIAWHAVRPIARWWGVGTMMCELRAVKTELDGTLTDYGVLGRRVVTTAWAEFIVDQLIAETSEFGDLKWHDSGAGTTAAVIGDTDIETTDAESRVAGTQVESSSVIYESVGVITYTTTLAITEHMMFTQVTGGTGHDRTVFAAINVVNTNTITFTLDYTITAGG